MQTHIDLPQPASDAAALSDSLRGLIAGEIEAAGSGLALVLGGHKDDTELLRQIQQQPEPAIAANGDNRRSRELRTYGIGAQIIADLGVRKMRVLSAPWKLTGLAGFGLEVVEYLEAHGEREEQA